LLQQLYHQSDGIAPLDVGFSFDTAVAGDGDNGRLPFRLSRANGRFPQTLEQLGVPVNHCSVRFLQTLNVRTPALTQFSNIQTAVTGPSPRKAVQ
jgi:hypothetical protein